MEQCRLPSSDSEESRRRRLLSSSVTKEAAEKACAHVRGAGKKACVFDGTTAMVLLLALLYCNIGSSFLHYDGHLTYALCCLAVHTVMAVGDVDIAKAGAYD